MLTVLELYRALNIERFRRALTWRAIGRGVEISPSTFTRMREGRDISANAYIALMDWLEESQIT